MQIAAHSCNTRCYKVAAKEYQKPSIVRLVTHHQIITGTEKDDDEFTTQQVQG